MKKLSKVAMCHIVITPVTVLIVLGAVLIGVRNTRPVTDREWDVFKARVRVQLDQSTDNGIMSSALKDSGMDTFFDTLIMHVTASDIPIRHQRTYALKGTYPKEYAEQFQAANKIARDKFQMAAIGNMFGLPHGSQWSP